MVKVNGNLFSEGVLEFIVQSCNYQYCCPFAKKLFPYNFFICKETKEKELLQVWSIERHWILAIQMVLTSFSKKSYAALSWESTGSLNSKEFGKFQ